MKIESVILSAAMRYLLPLILLFSIYLLMRGHNEPGGGFIGGLVASTAFALHAITYDVQTARQELRIAPRTLIALGLLVALISGCFGWFIGQPFMTGLWYREDVPIIGKIGTPLLFDLGVYFVVIGITLLIIFSLAEEAEKGAEI